MMTSNSRTLRWMPSSSNTSLMMSKARLRSRQRLRHLQLRLLHMESRKKDKRMSKCRMTVNRVKSLSTIEIYSRSTKTIWIGKPPNRRCRSMRRPRMKATERCASQLNSISLTTKSRGKLSVRCSTNGPLISSDIKMLLTYSKNLRSKRSRYQQVYVSS